MFMFILIPIFVHPSVMKENAKGYKLYNLVI